MEKYSFFDAVNVGGEYDRKYNSADMARYFSSFIGNGVYVQSALNLKVIPQGNDVAVESGKAWINGYFYENTDTKPIQIALGNATLPRKDRVVLSLNLTKRVMELIVREGVPAVTPYPPSLIRNELVWDIGLAEVYVRAGANSFTAADITDTRYNSNVCGVVSGVVEQIDTTELFSQYDDEFNTWFENLQIELSGDVAANLQVQINEVENSVSTLENRVQPIEKGGTGAATLQAAKNTFGIGVVDAAMEDYIVAQHIDANPANWSWTKYASGKCSAHRNYKYSGKFTSVINYILYYFTLQPTLPFAFAQPPQVNLTLSREISTGVYASGVHWGCILDTTTTSFRFHHMSIQDYEVQEYTANIIVEGRWK